MRLNELSHSPPERGGGSFGKQSSGAAVQAGS